MSEEVRKSLGDNTAEYENLTPEHRAYVDGVIAGLTMATQTAPAPTPAN